MKLGEVVCSTHAYFNFEKKYTVLLIDCFSVQNFKMSVELCKSYIVRILTLEMKWIERKLTKAFLHFSPIFDVFFKVERGGRENEENSCSTCIQSIYSKRHFPLLTEKPKNSVCRLTVSFTTYIYLKTYLVGKLSTRLYFKRRGMFCSCRPDWFFFI